MKTFIFLLILIVALFGYIFFYASAPQSTDEIVEAQPVPTLERIEPNDTSAAIDEEITELVPAKHPENTQYVKQNNRTERETEIINDAPTQKKQALNRIRANDSQKLTPIQEDMTFMQLKEIIARINPKYPQDSITLDTPMRSLLRNDSQREAFVQEIARNFHINHAQLTHYMARNRLLWDWVNMLR